jgi:peptidoglycan/LPS O-acetylase OafA/YrhL
VGALRLCLALLVATAHLAAVVKAIPVWLIGHAVFAVRAFFVLSGFYMALVLSERYDRPWAFYASRLMKLLPIYWLISVVTILGAAAVAPSDLLPPFGIGAQWQRTSLVALPLTPLAYTAATLTTLVGSDSWVWLGFAVTTGAWSTAPAYGPYATSVLGFSGAPQAWTLGLELWFYLLAPFLVRMSTTWLVGLIAASLGLRACCQAYIAGTVYDRALFPLELVFFLLGIVAFRCGPAIARLNAGMLATSLIATIGLCAVAYFEFISTGPYPSWVTACAPFAALAVTIPFLFLVTKSSGIDAALGALSYPAYVAQFLVFAIVYQAATRLPSIDPTWWAALLLNLACLVVFSIATDRMIAQPVDRLRLRFGARVRPRT